MMYYSLSSIVAVVALPTLILAGPFNQKRDTTCNATAVSLTTYSTSANETLFHVAAAVNRSVCDIARVNRMYDPNYLTFNQTLLIPENNCNPNDNTTCLLVNSNSNATCVYGGPHTYISVLNDTVRYIAQYKLHISVPALTKGGPSGTNLSDPDAILPAGSLLKVPLCANSVCTIEPVSFEYGVLRDLAEEYGTTVGQISGLNYNFYHSDSFTAGPTLTVPMDCHCPTGKNCSRVLT